MKNQVALEQFKAESLISIARAKRLKNAAMEAKGRMDLQEARLLSSVFDKRGGFMNLEPQVASDLAQASRDSLIAAERLAHAKVKEAEERLYRLRNDLELARVHVLEADTQVHMLFKTINSEQISVHPPTDLVPEFPDPLPFSISLEEQCDSNSPHSDRSDDEMDSDKEEEESCNGSEGM